MTEQQHPITPPPKLVQQWRNAAPPLGLNREQWIATQAARWGADQELEACSEWLLNSAPWTVDPNERPEWVQTLKRCRRPKPPNLAEQALDAQERVWIGGTTTADWVLIRIALRRLQELEKGNE